MKLGTGFKKYLFTDSWGSIERPRLHLITRFSKIYPLKGYSFFKGVIGEKIFVWQDFLEIQHQYFVHK